MFLFMNVIISLWNVYFLYDFIELSLMVFCVCRFEKDGDDGVRDDGYNSEFFYGSDLYRDEEDRYNLV